MFELKKQELEKLISKNLLIKSETLKIQEFQI